MFRTPLLRLYNTSRHFIRIIPETLRQPVASNPVTASNMSRPTGLIANKGLELLTLNTPNGVKASILLEELRAAYANQPDYVAQTINIMENVQKEPWFSALGPNGRIPVLVDHDNNGLAIMEGFAILNYLTRHYDPEKKFAYTEDPLLSEQEQWIAWQHGGLGPMQGQANHFYRFAKERIPYPTQRYVGETERLYGILDARLKDRQYLVGDHYSIADINAFGWVNGAYFAGIQLKEQFPNVWAWWERVNARPAVQKGLAVPTGQVGSFGNGAFRKRLDEDGEARGKEEGLREELRKAQELYGYKYASP